LIVLTEAGTNCFSAIGKLKCERDPYRAADAEVYLMDDDGALNNDDQMGKAISDENGSFKVEGCGYDFTTDPDPYLKIINICNGDTVITTRVTLPHKFQPEIIDVVTIKLDCTH